MSVKKGEEVGCFSVFTVFTHLSLDFYREQVNPVFWPLCECNTLIFSALRYVKTVKTEMKAFPSRKLSVNQWVNSP